ncbi:putative RDD family membrane protein YckC [Pedobacter sp. CG_S7]|uniref:RDD family protein n=1 Tax=Pedobacter sp. CG_S7 TaxID=3143930 RepID=UPI003395B518
MGNELYTIVINGKPQGPYALDRLSSLKIQPDTFVRKPGMDDYKEAHEFPELRALLGFDFQQTAPQYFASFDQRLLATVIDFFFIILGYIGLMLVAFIVVTEKTERITLFVSFSPLVLITKFLYASIAEASIKQGTIGKRLLNVKVTDMMGNRISLSHSFLRNTAKILSVIPLFFGYLYSFLNRKQQCWHDIAANTLVIKDRLI